jgi:hypothetical protein
MDRVAGLPVCPGQVRQLMAEEARNCRDVSRLCAVATAACHLVTCPQPTGLDAVQLLLSLLGNRYPKVLA